MEEEETKEDDKMEERKKKRKRMKRRKNIKTIGRKKKTQGKEKKRKRKMKLYVALQHQLEGPGRKLHLTCAISFLVQFIRLFM